MTELNNGILGSLLEEEIQVMVDETVGENEGYRYNLKFVSLEGYDITWKEEQANQLKQQILNNQAIVEKLQDWLALENRMGDEDFEFSIDIETKLRDILRTTEHSEGKAE